MKKSWHKIALTASALTPLLILPAQAQPFSQAPAPITGATQASVAPATTQLQALAAKIETGLEAEVISPLKALVNTPQDLPRAQARYLLAQALQRQGRTNEALSTLEGTLTDTTPLGRAIGTLRGQLLLQQAETALLTNQTDLAARALNDYERLTEQPDKTRFKRLQFTLSGGQPKTTPLRVGVLLPQTGNLGEAGTDVLRALQLGLQQFNLGGKAVELIAADATTPAEVEKATIFLKGQQVSLIVGPLLAPSVASAAAKAGSVPLLTLSSDSEALGQGVHTLNYLPSAQAAMATKAQLAKGRTRFAALVPQGAYGEAALAGLRNAAQAAGATVGKVSFYDPTQTDIGPSIRDLGTGFDALFIPAPGRTVPLVAAQLAYYDLDKEGVKLFGTALWNDPAILSSTSNMLNGAQFAAPSRNTAFTQAFSQTYGTASHPLAAMGYDAAALLSQIAAAQAYSGNAPSQILLRPEGFYATGGYYRFFPNGQTERGLGLTDLTQDTGLSQFAERQLALPQAPLPLPTPLLPADTPKAWW